MNIELNWIRTFIIIIFIPNFLWIIPNRVKWIFIKTIKILNNEIILLYKIKNFKSPSFIFIRLFIFIFLNNFFSLFPYIFSSSSHIVFSLRLALPFWLFYIIISIFINTKNIIAHLIPLNTPIYLAPLITIIETIRILIRPLSLSIRLTANLIAGHLLITLLNFNSLIIIILIIQLFIIIFEICVALIQSYVFSILSSLYSRE